jgi:hypothetical protein
VNWHLFMTLALKPIIFLSIYGTTKVAP